MNWIKFFNMGGYALYVWGSYGVTAAVVLAEVLAVRARRRNAMSATEHSGRPEHQ